MAFYGRKAIIIFLNELAEYHSIYIVILCHPALLIGSNTVKHAFLFKSIITQEIDLKATH